MRIDKATIDLVPRTTSNCLDLSVLFCGRHLKPVGKLWLAIAGPSILLVYVLSRYYQFSFWIVPAALFLASSPLGILLAWGTAGQCFGEPFRVGRMLKRLSRNDFAVLIKGVLLRLPIALGLLLLFFPGYILALRTGTWAEDHCFARMGGRLEQGKARNANVADDLRYRSGWILVFCGLIWMVLFFTLDFFANLLLGRPIFWGRFEFFDTYYSPEDLFFSIFDLLWYDPIVLTVLTATGFVAYTIGRLAWFFCYIDARVRYDLWDIELQFIQETQRLQQRE